MAVEKQIVSPESTGFRQRLTRIKDHVTGGAKRKEALHQRNAYVAAMIAPYRDRLQTPDQLPLEVVEVLRGLDLLKGNDGSPSRYSIRLATGKVDAIIKAAQGNNPSK